jgi:putative hydrolase of the HAD superfamily
VFDGLAFDLDDTLYLERDYVASGFRAAAAWCAATFGGDPEIIAAEFQQHFADGRSGAIFDEWLARRSLARETYLPALLSAYREHKPEIQPLSGARECLVELARRYQLALITDGSPERQRSKLEGLGLADLFNIVVISDEIAPDARKPDPRPFRIAAERLGLAPARIVYLGDNPLKDFLGARRAGLGSVRVRHPGGLHADREPPSDEHAPDAEVDVLSATAVEVAIESIARRWRG